MANEYVVGDLAIPGFTTPTIPGYDKPFGSWSTQEDNGSPQTPCVGCTPEQVQFNMEAPFLVAQQPLILDKMSPDGDTYRISGPILFNAYIVVKGNTGTSIVFTQELNRHNNDLVKPPFSGTRSLENHLPEFPIGRSVTIENVSGSSVSVSVSLGDGTSFSIASGEIYTIRRRGLQDLSSKFFTVTKEYPTT